MFIVAREQLVFIVLLRIKIYHNMVFLFCPLLSFPVYMAKINFLKHKNIFFATLLILFLYYYFSFVSQTSFLWQFVVKQIPCLMTSSEAFNRVARNDKHILSHGNNDS